MWNDDPDLDLAPSDHGVVDDWTEVECPYCGESMGIYLDPETQGHMVQDCEVCCRPWELEVRRDREGRLHLLVTAS